MGILDSIIKGVGIKVLGEAEQGGIMEQVIGLINNSQGGGLSGLVEQFTSKGMGGMISSWIGTGENHPVSGEQMEHVLGSDKI